MADWDIYIFAEEWRNGYLTTTRKIATGELEGPLNVDIMHREILDGLLHTAQWSHLGRAWDESTRCDLNLAWHRLNGWPDAVEGLHALKKHAIIATLSNGNMRLLIDMAKHAGLPWDTIFSTELFATFKPNPKAYAEPVRHLALPASQCAMVAAHIYDLRAAAQAGMRTVYVPRAGEDSPEIIATVKTKAEGGDVDYVVHTFTELAEIVFGGAK